MQAHIFATNVSCVNIYLRTAVIQIYTGSLTQRVFTPPMQGVTTAVKELCHAAHTLLQHFSAVSTLCDCADFDVFTPRANLDRVTPDVFPEICASRPQQPM